MVRVFALLAALTVITRQLPAGLNSEAGSFLFHNYAPTDYLSLPQNWAAVQDLRGIMYFANGDGILEFDGTTWRKIAVDGLWTRSLAIDSRGTIFVGGRGVFGYLSADSDGKTRFVSLINKLPPADRRFNDVWNVIPTAEGVYFMASNRVFLYTSGGLMKIFHPALKTSFGRAFVYRSEFFVTSNVRGLLTMQGGDLSPSGIHGDSSASHGFPVFANGVIPLIGTNVRLYHFSLSGIEPFPTQADSYFDQHQIFSINQLPSGEIVVGTKGGGLVILDQKGNLERIIRKADGLPSDSVNGVYFSREGSMWLMTDSGISNLSLNITHFSEKQGIHGPVYAAERIGNTLFVGTGLGLFRMRTNSQAEPDFIPDPNVQEAVFSIVQRSGIWFCATEKSLFVQSGTSFRRLLPHVIHGVYDIASSSFDSNIFYIAGVDGVQMLKHSGRDWSVVNKESTGQEFRSVTEDARSRVWATEQGSVWRIDLSVFPPKSEQYKNNRGVPPGLNYLSVFHGHSVLASQRGLLQFSEVQKRFVPDPELGSRFSSDNLVVSAVRPAPNGDVWVTGTGYHGFLRHGKPSDWYEAPLLNSKARELYWLYFDPDGTCWAAGDNGALFRYERPPPLTNQQFNVLVRGAILTNDERQIFGGAGTPPQLRLPHRDNAIRFEYAAPFFEGESAVQYQYRLPGSDSNWSPWTKETRKDYTNLFEGKYVFEVRAQSPHGVISKPAEYRFSLDPPWFRTWWAYAVYVAGFLFAGWLILRWRLKALEARNRWLEGVVEERTAEVRTERDQNEALLLNILPKPIASELRTTGAVKPSSFEDVTVCFSDFVGFTLSSEKLPPEELISSLNEYFTAFDEIIGRYGLEKLKTIGDAYMFAGGLPNSSPSHAVDAVLAALEMVEVVKKLARPDKGVNWSIRLGLYSGPVVAGVVGVRKFAFDIWGNTVNFAARMESAGSANRVNLSETTGKRVFDFIECEPRGAVRIKEGREMEMYFAIKPKSDLLTGAVVDGIPESFRIRYEQAFSKPPKSFPGSNGFHV